MCCKQRLALRFLGVLVGLILGLATVGAVMTIAWFMGS